MKSLLTIIGAKEICPECGGQLWRDEHPDGYIDGPYCCEDCEYTDKVSELDDIQENTDSLEEKFGVLNNL